MKLWQSGESDFQKLVDQIGELTAAELGEFVPMLQPVLNVAEGSDLRTWILCHGAFRDTPVKPQGLLRSIPLCRTRAPSGI